MWPCTWAVCGAAAAAVVYGAQVYRCTMSEWALWQWCTGVPAHYEQPDPTMLASRSSSSNAAARAAATFAIPICTAVSGAAGAAAAAAEDAPMCSGAKRN